MHLSLSHRWVLNVSLFSVCLSVWSLLAAWAPAAAPFPFSAFNCPSFTAFLSQVPHTYLLPRALYLLNSAHSEKRHIPNISNTSASIFLVGDCLVMEQTSPFSFIRQTVHVQAKHNVKHKTLEMKDEGPVFFRPATCSHRIFLLI